MVPAVNWWVHAIGDGQELGYVTKRFRIGQNGTDVFMTEQGPTHESAVGDGTALTHFIVCLELIFQDRSLPWIPIFRLFFGHNLLPQLVVQ